MFWCFGRQACGILAPRPGMEPALPALEGEVLTTGRPGKSQQFANLNRSLGIVLVEEATLKESHEGGERASHAEICGMSVLASVY